jgi:hypothetical protein
MELVSNPLGGAVALDRVALDVSGDHPPSVDDIDFHAVVATAMSQAMSQFANEHPPLYASLNSACDLLLYNPLARLLGYALAVALVPPMAALNLAFDLVVNMARYARAGNFVELLVELLAHLPRKLLMLPTMTCAAIFCTPHAILIAGVFPWLASLLFALPVWRSPTAKLRAFAGAGDAGAASRLLGATPGEAARRLLAGARAGPNSWKRIRLGAELLRGVDGSRGGAYGDDACLAVVQRLLAEGADPDHTDGQGKSALFISCGLGYLATARALLEAGADPNLRDLKGKTPLHWAAGGVAGASDAEPEAVALLLEAAWATDPSLVDDLSLVPLIEGRGGQTAFMGAKPDARPVLLPSPGWDAVAGALNATGEDGAAAAVQALLLGEQRGLCAFQLIDLLWDDKLEPDAAARVARRRLVFDKLVAPLVHAAPARKLEPAEKALLIHACQATAGPDQALGRAASREGHRADFDALLATVMGQFEAQLAADYAALAAMTGGAELLALPATALLHGTTKGGLRQDAPAVGGPAPWLDAGAGGDLAGAYRFALEPSGAVDSPEALCVLLQGGRNPMFAGSHLAHFSATAETTAFWQHICALQSVARHKPINAEFHAHIKAKLHGVEGACFKDAPLKGYERIAVKAAQYHTEESLPATPAGAGAAAARVIDIVRCSFEVPSAQSALALCAWLDAATLEQHGVLALRRKNGFHQDAPSAGGYRDIKYNLLYQSQSVAGSMGRVIVEVQIIVEAYLKVKKKMHAVYRIARGDFG